MHLLATIYLETSSSREYSKSHGKDKTKTVEEAFALLQKCAECSKDPSKLLLEYINATNRYGTKRHKLAAIAYCQQKCFFEFTDFNNNPSTDLEVAIESLKSSSGAR